MIVAQTFARDDRGDQVRNATAANRSATPVSARNTTSEPIMSPRLVRSGCMPTMIATQTAAAKLSRLTYANAPAVSVITAIDAIETIFTVARLEPNAAMTSARIAG